MEFYGSIPTSSVIPSLDRQGKVTGRSCQVYDVVGSFINLKCSADEHTSGFRGNQAPGPFLCLASYRFALWELVIGIFPPDVQSDMLAQAAGSPTLEIINHL